MLSSLVPHNLSNESKKLSLGKRKNNHLHRKSYLIPQSLQTSPHIHHKWYGAQGQSSSQNKPPQGRGVQRRERILSVPSTFQHGGVRTRSWNSSETRGENPNLASPTRGLSSQAERLKRNWIPNRVFIRCDQVSQTGEVRSGDVVIRVILLF